MTLALYSPSVCNRQSVRVHVFTEPSVIAKAQKLQGGMTGYEPPPVLALVTSDLAAFSGSSQRHQPFIDGGLFAMSLLNGLEYYGLAACSLNAMFSTKREAQMRQLLGIPDNEVLIFFIAIGNKPDITTVPHSRRLNLNSVLSIH